jgi:hypothetical protein
MPIVIHNITVVTYLPLYRSVNSLLYNFLLRFIEVLVVVKQMKN